jgi:hypothetical protein
MFFHIVALKESASAELTGFFRPPFCPPVGMNAGVGV